jgi:hypothetical protein
MHHHSEPQGDCQAQGPDCSRCGWCGSRSHRRQVLGKERKEVTLLCSGLTREAAQELARSRPGQWPFFLARIAATTSLYLHSASIIVSSTALQRAHKVLASPPQQACICTQRRSSSVALHCKERTRFSRRSRQQSAATARSNQRQRIKKMSFYCSSEQRQSSADVVCENCRVPIARSGT